MTSLLTFGKFLKIIELSISTSNESSNSQLKVSMAFYILTAFWYVWTTSFTKHMHLCLSVHSPRHGSAKIQSHRKSPVGQIAEDILAPFTNLSLHHGNVKRAVLSLRALTMFMLFDQNRGQWNLFPFFPIFLSPPLKYDCSCQSTAGDQVPTLWSAPMTSLPSHQSAHI